MLNADRLLAFALLTLSISACANSTEQFEKGLRDGAIGKPVISGDSAQRERSASNEIATASLSSYSLANMKPTERPALETDEAGLWLSLEDDETKIRLAGNRITDDKLNSYVKGVVCKITGPYCPELRVYLVRVPLFNASMYPNGMMIVNSGLLLRARNEAEMASVLGHEFGHYLRRHTLQRHRDTSAKADAFAFASLGLSVIGAPPGTRELMGVAAVASISAFSRDHEREADGYGLRVLFDNNYDLYASPAMWERALKEDQLATGEEETFSIFLSHPLSSERLTEQRKIADGLASRISHRELGRERYLEHILPHRASFLEDEISTKPQKHSLAVLDILIEDGVRLGELYYYKGEIYRRGNAKDGPTEALKLYELALKSEGFPTEIHKSIALARLALGQKDKARTEFETYLAKSPKAQDAHLVRMQIEELK
ncbi:MAG: M48 family metalloprotease [Alphaproteobacteria bacterium]|nr:M48 family metalloprotease [Alphaproteobacteria bacterium]